MFDSGKEADRYGELKLLQAGNVISDLICHPKFRLVVNGIDVGGYKPDFGYTENSTQVIEDVKSNPTRTEAYRLRVKVFQACYPHIDFREVGLKPRKKRKK